MASGEQLKSFKNHEFKTPTRLIKGPEDLEKWEKCQAYHEFLGFLHIVNDSVKGKNMKDDVPCSQTIDKILAILSSLSVWVDEIPLDDQPHQRFGNTAYKVWWEKMRSSATDQMSELLTDELQGAVIELEFYYRQSFGNPTRIDYGTGHEFKFCAFLCCLMKLGLLTKSDAPALALRVLRSYLDLVRKLQRVYRMEPAGSHGVWGLDDFQFMPFIWGSAQLIGHSKLEPKSFVEEGVADLYAEEFLFMACVKFINSVKTGPFAEHSNTLWGISGVGDWAKVNSGLIKMYKAEVLGKFPVIQHFPFGTILSLDPAQS